MKILFFCWAIDLRVASGIVPWWWQILKGLYELGQDLVVVPYYGEGVESLWWRTVENPSVHAGKVATRTLGVVEALPLIGPWMEKNREHLVGRFARAILRRAWDRKLNEILAGEKFDAVVIAHIPLNHIAGIPSELRRRYDVATIYYDCDGPASLPRFKGAEAIRLGYYVDANLDEYDLFVMQSEGGADELRRMGARRVEVVHIGADPGAFAPVDRGKDTDVLYFGMGPKGRNEWLRLMLAEPSLMLRDRTFAYAGGFPRWGWKGFAPGAARYLGPAAITDFRTLACRSRVNLNVTRNAHAQVYASSTSRLFELAALGCCIVSNPILGIERWFEPGREVWVVNNGAEATELYRDLLGNDSLRETTGHSARRRLLREHTHVHRAQQLVDYISALRYGGRVMPQGEQRGPGSRELPS